MNFKTMRFVALALATLIGAMGTIGLLMASMLAPPGDIALAFLPPLKMYGLDGLLIFFAALCLVSAVALFYVVFDAHLDEFRDQIKTASDPKLPPS